MNHDELVDDSAIWLAVSTDRPVAAGRATTRSSRIPIVLLVVAAVIVLVGAIVLNHINTRELIRLDLLSQYWS